MSMTSTEGFGHLHLLTQDEIEHLSVSPTHLEHLLVKDDLLARHVQNDEGAEPEEKSDRQSDLPGAILRARDTVKTDGGSPRPSRLG
jgi:hypothetical protein